MRAVWGDSAWRFASWGARLCPESWVPFISRLLGGLWFYGLRYRKNVVLTQLARTYPELDARALHRLAHRVFCHLAQTGLEFLRIPRYRRRGFSQFVRIEGLQHHRHARTEGRGVLILSGHLGSWELAVGAVAREAAPLHLVVKSFSPGTERFITRIRADSGLSVISAQDGMKAILRALGRNETVVFVLDQNATRSQGIFVNFLGRPACTLSSLAWVSLRTHAPVLPAIPYREEDGRQVLEIGPPIPLTRAETRRETVHRMTEVYTHVLETAIRARPEQWLWTHKRWRTTP